MPQEFEMRAWDDLHVHLRNPGPDGLMPLVLRHSVAFCERVLGMPNTEPCLATGIDAKAYALAVNEELIRQDLDHLPFRLLTTIKLLSPTPGATRWTTPDEIWLAAGSGVVAAKLYPLAKVGIGTTGAQAEGVDLNRLKQMYPVFAAMAKVGMVLCVHGQIPSSFTWYQERDFLPLIAKLAEDIPDLIIVLEHVSTAEGVAWVKSARPGVYATITAHHFCLTADDVLGCLHHHCMPPILRPEDRAAIREVVFLGHPKFFFGSDSAPHLWANKAQVGRAPAGVYSAPVVPGKMVDEFEQVFGSIESALPVLEPFTSELGARAYGLPFNKTRIQLVREQWRVPKEINGIVPMCPDQLVGWQVAGRA